ncbi:hypothetical protein SDC9_145787 [bioreactor metagenome]|uniref:Uncharacterized protein n=1 Tax=bioreactor metagenome TaxID=1076179 RepID=A0A645EBA8_9ZZZZ
MKFSTGGGQNGNFEVPDDIKATLSSEQGQKIMNTISSLDEKTMAKLTQIANSVDKTMLSNMLKNNPQVKATLNSPDLVDRIKKLLGE